MEREKGGTVRSNEGPYTMYVATDGPRGTKYSAIDGPGGPAVLP